MSPDLAEEDVEEKLVADFCNIILRTPLYESSIEDNPNMSIVVAPRNHPMPMETYSDFQETYEIHDSIFQNVYINEIDDREKFEILYNTDFGIIGLRSYEHIMIDLVFDRIEFE